ncbi:hypothetical protein [Tolypothrix sp. NIES-4075]|nr:hypothetical protein [Tolypothrix sp. NIES-4075]
MLSSFGQSRSFRGETVGGVSFCPVKLSNPEDGDRHQFTHQIENG